MLRQLALIANQLDSRGLTKEADALDLVIKSAASIPFLSKFPKGSSDLTEDELAKMTAEEYVELVNAERAEINFALKHRGERPMPMMEYDHEKAFIKYDTALDMVRDDLIGTISDVFKDINGIRPRFYNYKEMSLNELSDKADELIQESQEMFKRDEMSGHEGGWYGMLMDREDEELQAMRDHVDEENARYDAIRAEEERMKIPEEGEEIPSREGIGRRFSKKYLDL